MTDRCAKLLFVLLWSALAWTILPCIGPAAAQTVWDMPTEYPQTAMPGLGLTTFTSLVSAGSGGRLTIRPSYDAAAGIRSAGMLKAISDGTLPAGDAFASALEADDPIFALSALPFLATSIEDARRLAMMARPHIEAALHRRGVRLLYLTPWPPTGLWTKTPLRTPQDLVLLKVRTYDAVSREVMAGVGAEASTISFADTMPKLIDGSLDAVLSSGDGGAGRKLWQYLPQFSEIGYALPLSVAMVGEKGYDALSPDLRRAVDDAAAGTEAALWTALTTRLQANYARMRENGVTIDGLPSPQIIDALKASAASAQSAWCQRAGPVCADVMGRYRATP